ncbi:MAG: hypothetical protein HC836_48495 [Richelia sp. RM2_1_2]|nr:hypothetical protein [Richelia sp. RM1_1_1]NJO65646.1 hypothetical protein [Richelia sp. RM2_1_2]
MPDKKRSYPSFDVTYWGSDDTPSKIITVRPAPVRGKSGSLKDVIVNQEILIKSFVEHDGRLASLIIDSNTWNAMERLAKMLPVVGQDKPGFDIEQIAESGDIAQLGRIFFSENIADDLNRDRDSDGNIINSPSLIAKIHDINFSATLYLMIREREEAQQKQRMEKLESNLKELQSPVADASK